ncbi:MAG TPA: T9SS type A sorting domain-containing protein [Saprospiraceae bacterium]|nr:T9SS type A sorting domain-containing protein [Saprospiraceae bacterium]
MKHSLHSVFVILSMCTLLSYGTSVDAMYGNFYVKASATGTNEGSSWTDAFTDLQSALDVAASGDQICVAAGTYFPTFRHNGDSLRHSTFYIAQDIILLGGFSGEPGTEGNMVDRDPQVHLTMLSGDIGVFGDNVDNAFHVVFFDLVSDTALLDGFIIEKGNGFGGAGFEAIGAGIFNNAEGGRSHPTISNCVIRDNITSESGGGFYIQAGSGGEASSLITNCTFLRNRASGGGGVGIYTDTDGNASPVLINCAFMANKAPTASGGAIVIIAHSAVASPRMINCIFSGNDSPSSSAVNAFVTGTAVTRPEFINCAFSGNTGAAARVVNLGTGSCALIARNSIFWNNAGGAGVSSTNADIDVTFSIIPFGFPGEGNIGLDPMFVSTPPLDSAHTLGDLHLLPGSPAFDAGRNADVPAGITTDFDGNPRFVNAVNGQPGTVDIGPYEFQGNTTGVSDFLSDTDWRVFPNPATDHIVITISKKGESGELQFLDARGSIITTLHLQSGQDDYAVEVSQLPAGTYFVHLVVDGLQDVKKVIVE